ncbi:adenine methyltransferase [Enterovirga sp. DB1703]|uniref:Adenine methyltransferase n=2 Tax=Enterovirga aerilata TaxID=2730920 RepID=A0A849IFN5_9HYPH|nr:adenine methyltransferase [Enterovirga sp. DB1703]
MGGHHSPVPETHVWLTPPEILEALGGAESFDLDPAACSEPRPWPTAKRHLTVEDDGLAHPWKGRVWLNPPYGGPNIIGPWMRRMAIHNHGTALIFARTETDVFQETVFGRATGILFLHGRLTFHRPDGSRAEHNGGAPSCLVAYGDADLTILQCSGLDGTLVTRGELWGFGR